MSTSYKPKYFETLDGARYPKVSLRETHATVQLSMAIVLRRLAGTTGRVGVEWELRVGDVDGTDSILQPDVSCSTSIPRSASSWRMLTTGFEPMRTASGSGILRRHGWYSM